MKKTPAVKKYKLFTPGPVNIRKTVRAAIARTDICHREKDFEDLLMRIETKLLQLFGLRTKKDYRAVVITGSGTAANEAILSSVVGDQNILILSNGEFGERLLNISKIHNKNTFSLKFGWGEEMDLKKIENAIKNQGINVLAMVHHETCTGMLNPIQEIGALAKKHRVTFVTDCVSSAGAEKIDLEKGNIAFCSSASGKAIASYPGLSFVIGRKQDFERLKDLPQKTTYLNLYKFYRFITDLAQTPNTPAVPLFYALEQALTDILEKTPSGYRKEILERAKLLRKGMKEMGLKFLANEKKMSSILTTVLAPTHIDVEELQTKLREKHIIIYAGKGELKGKVFQVGNIGEISKKEIGGFLKTLKDIIETN